MKKKCILFIICMLGIANLTQAKTYFFTINGLEYTILDDKKSLSVSRDFESEPLVGHVEIPSTVTYRNKKYTVRHIGSFSGCDMMTSVSIPQTVEHIEGMAFNDCGSLQSINIPDAVNDIGDFVFCNCFSLTSVKLPHHIPELSSGMFFNCTSLQSITIPNSVKSIGTLCFRSCYNLSEVELPASLETIENYAFSSCKKLHSISLPMSVNLIGKEAFMGCENLMEVFSQRANRMLPIDSIPNYYETFDVQDNHVLCRINEDGKTLTVYKPTNKVLLKCIIPEEIEQDSICYIVTSIDDDAFKECVELQDVYLPSSVTHIGSNTFKSCAKLKHIFVPIGTLDKFKQLLPQELYPKLKEKEPLIGIPVIIKDSPPVPTPVIKKDELIIESVPFGSELVQDIATNIPPPPVDSEKSLSTDEDRIFDLCEEMPKFPGGNEAFAKFIKEHINYPEDAAKAGIEGKVIVKFVIRKDGSVDDVRIAKGVFPSLDREAIRVAKQIEFIPGWNEEGKPLNVRYAIPVTFSLKDK